MLEKQRENVSRLIRPDCFSTALSGAMPAARLDFRNHRLASLVLGALFVMAMTNGDIVVGARFRPGRISTVRAASANPRSPPDACEKPGQYVVTIFPHPDTAVRLALEFWAAVVRARGEFVRLEIGGSVVELMRAGSWESGPVKLDSGDLQVALRMAARGQHL